MQNEKPVISNFNKGFRVSCWEQVSREGKQYYSVSVQRKYKSKEGEDKTESLHIFQDDMLPLLELIRNTYNDLNKYKDTKRNIEKQFKEDSWK